MGERAAGAGTPWRPPKLVEVPGYYNHRESWEPDEDDGEEGMYAWLDEVIEEGSFGRIDTWLQNSGRYTADDGTLMRERIVDLTAPEHDDMSLFMVAIRDTRPASIATFKELVKQMPDRSYRDRKGRTALDHLKLAMAANPGNPVLQQKFDLYQATIEQAANVGRLYGVSKQGLPGTLNRDTTNIVASMLTGAPETTPALVQKSQKQAEAGLSGVKGGRRRKTRKGKGKKRHHTRRRR